MLIYFTHIIIFIILILIDTLILQYEFPHKIGELTFLYFFISVINIIVSMRFYKINQLKNSLNVLFINLLIYFIYINSNIRIFDNYKIKIREFILGLM